MSYVFKREDITRMKKCLSGDLSWKISLNKRERSNLMTRSTNFVLQNEKLYLRDGSVMREMIPDDEGEELNQVLESLHLPDHKGVKAMYMNCQILYAGFKRERINEYVRRCEICRRHRPMTRVSSITPIVAEHPWERIQIDCVDMRNYSDHNDGYGWILNIIDIYSKYLYSFPMKSKTAVEVKEAVEQVILLEGAPRIVQTDNGKEFANQLLTAYLNSEHVSFVRGRPRHPQNQGQVERLNQTIVKKLAKHFEGQPVKRWIGIHRKIVATYNRTWHRSINLSPMMAFRGRTGVNSSYTSKVEEAAIIESGSELNEPIVDDDYLVADLSTLVEEDSVASVEIAPSHTQPRVQSEYRARYIQKMINDADVHYNSITINPGDFVLVAKDFDTNPETRRRKMDGFYEEGSWLVLERVGADNLKVQSLANMNIVRIVCKNRLKRILLQPSAPNPGQ